mgnify:CR=1 FL=1
MSKTLDPLGTPATWREFLFDSVLLTWQTGRLKAKTGDFNKRILGSELGLLVLRKSKLANLLFLRTSNPNSDPKILLLKSPVFAFNRPVCHVSKTESNKNSRQVAGVPSGSSVLLIPRPTRNRLHLCLAGGWMQPGEPAQMRPAPAARKSHLR